ncbi:LHFPL tetraspan subfamily member 6 protein-like [Bacillus rossius redtenbacheri]|uniref:LHFPL tetraspan subfamily member 6 protein-like n=1 Tax=Bacillus rossius redtenbacheri TaxID=93214 RepID=UPI002FDCB5FC
MAGAAPRAEWSVSADEAVWRRAERDGGRRLRSADSCRISSGVAAASTAPARPWKLRRARECDGCHVRAAVPGVTGSREMATSLTGVGLTWAALSLLAALLSCTGFYLPFWIQGRLLGKVDAYFSSFRRCNYPRVSPQGVVEIVMECGRYSSFWDIPSPWWQASTVLVGTGSALSLLVAVTAAAACCITYVVHAGTARLAGALQLLAAVLVSGGAVAYPAGWDNREVRESCGDSSSSFQLGTCEYSWSLYLLGSAVGLLLLCFSLSFCASRVKHGSFRI